MRNLGYSLLATALRTDAGAQPPGFTAHAHTNTQRNQKILRIHSAHIQVLGEHRPLVANNGVASTHSKVLFLNKAAQYSQYKNNL